MCPFFALIQNFLNSLSQLYTSILLLQHISEEQKSDRSPGMGLKNASMHS